MLKDLHGKTRLVIPALVAAAVLTAPGTVAGKTATAKTPSRKTQAVRLLRGLGYTHLHVSCSRKGICHWTGVHKGRACTGVIRAARGRHGPLRLSAVHCTSAPTVAGSPRPPLALAFNTYTDAMTVSKQREVGATVTRLFVNWYQVEPQQGVWTWSTSDQQYQQIVAGGLRPVVVVQGAPCWAVSGCSVLFQSPPSPSYDADWSAYVRAVTSRYPKAVGIEIWNEPNLSATFYPQADPQRYTQLLSEAYTAVKSVNKAMPVLGGSVLMNDGAGTGAAGYASRTFLAGMYAAGAQHYMDALAIHVYPTTPANGTWVWDPADMSRDLQQVDGLEAAAGVKPQPIWVTEMGVSTATESGFPPAVTPDQQASDLISMIHTAQADADVRLVTIDSLQDAAPDPLGAIVNGITGSLLNWDVSYNQVEAGFGVFADNWIPKPAACAVSKAFGGSLSCGT